MDNRVMAKHVIHVSDAEAASDFASLLERVGTGTEIVIEYDARPVTVLHAAEPVRRTQKCDAHGRQSSKLLLLLGLLFRRLLCFLRHGMAPVLTD